MLKGHNAQSINKALNIPANTVYKDIQFLSEKNNFCSSSLYSL